MTNGVTTHSISASLSLNGVPAAATAAVGQWNDYILPSGIHNELHLANSIRSAISEKNQDHPWETTTSHDINSIRDTDIVESIQPFAQQIQSKVKELELNLTAVLDEFNGVVMSSTEVNWNADDDESNWHPSLQDPYAIPSFNYSLVCMFDVH
jgi:hypothetical protein